MGIPATGSAPPSAAGRLPPLRASSGRKWLPLLCLALAACDLQPQGPRVGIVSLNPCSDAVLAEVAAPGQLLAISHYSQSPASSSMDLEAARRYRATSGALEEVLALRPAIVVADRFLPAATAAALESQGIVVERLPIAASVAESRAQVARLAGIAGQPARGAALLGRIDAALAAATPPPGARPGAALVWQSGGIVPGPDTLIGDLLRRTGFVQTSARQGMRQADVLPLERLLADPPQVILAAGNPRAQEDRMLAHPALTALPATRRARLDPALLWCGGPTIVRAAERLAAVRRSFETGKPFPGGEGA
jgi:iron complex transport system substrate-binding protein